VTRYDAEEALLHHYAERPDYGSPLDSHSPAKIAGQVGVEELRGPILDVGCGDGRLAAALPGIQVVGIDYCAERIAKASARGLVFAKFILGDAWDLPGEDQTGTYPTIFAVEVLEHLARPRRMVALLRRLLAPGGVLIATVPRAMPYEAHLQVFATVEQVHDQLEPQVVSEALRQHWVLRWGPL